VVSAAVLSHVLSMAAVGGSVELGPEQVREEFREDTNRWMERLLQTGLSVERVSSEVAFGEPGNEILAAARRLGSGLIVMGRRGAGRIRRALLGSVTNEVLRGTGCPVLVVNEPEGAAGSDRGAS